MREISSDRHAGGVNVWLFFNLLLAIPFLVGALGYAFEQAGGPGVFGIPDVGFWSLYLLGLPGLGCYCVVFNVAVRYRRLRSPERLMRLVAWAPIMAAVFTVLISVGLGLYQEEGMVAFNVGRVFGLFVVIIGYVYVLLFYAAYRLFRSVLREPAIA